MMVYAVLAIQAVPRCSLRPSPGLVWVVLHHCSASLRSQLDSAALLSSWSLHPPPSSPPPPTQWESHLLLILCFSLPTSASSADYSCRNLDQLQEYQCANKLGKISAVLPPSEGWQKFLKTSHMETRLPSDVTFIGIS